MAPESLLIILSPSLTPISGDEASRRIIQTEVRQEHKCGRCVLEPFILAVLCAWFACI